VVSRAWIFELIIFVKERLYLYVDAYCSNWICNNLVSDSSSFNLRISNKVWNFFYELLVINYVKFSIWTKKGRTPWWILPCDEFCLRFTNKVLLQLTKSNEVLYWEWIFVELNYSTIPPECTFFFKAVTFNVWFFMY